MDQTATKWRCYLNVVLHSECFGQRTIFDWLALILRFSVNRRLEAAQAIVGYHHVRLLLLKGPPNLSPTDLPRNPDAIGAAWELTLASKSVVPDYGVAFFCNDPDRSANEFKHTGLPISDKYRLKHKTSHTYIYCGTIAISLSKVDEYAQKLRALYRQNSFLIGVRDCEGFALDLYRKIVASSGVKQDMQIRQKVLIGILCVASGYFWYFCICVIGLASLVSLLEVFFILGLLLIATPEFFKLPPIFGPFEAFERDKDFDRDNLRQFVFDFSLEFWNGDMLLAWKLWYSAPVILGVCLWLSWWIGLMSLRNAVCISFVIIISTADQHEPENSKYKYRGLSLPGIGRSFIRACDSFKLKHLNAQRLHFAHVFTMKFRHQKREFQLRLVDCCQLFAPRAAMERVWRQHKFSRKQRFWHWEREPLRWRKREQGLRNKAQGRWKA